MLSPILSMGAVVPARWGARRLTRGSQMMQVRLTEARVFEDERMERLARFLTRASLLLMEGGEPREYEELSARWKDIGDLGEAIKSAHQRQPTK